MSKREHSPVARVDVPLRRRYFFFDIDGTLAIGTPAHRFVPESARMVIHELQQKGHFTAIATGRTASMAQPFLDACGMTSMVCDGGAGLMLDGELLSVEPLNRDLAVALLTECDAKDIAWSVITTLHEKRISPDTRFDERADLYIPHEIDPAFDFRQAPRFYKIFLALKADQEPLVAALSALPSVRFSPDCLFVEPKSKEVGIRKLMGIMGAPLSNVVVFGDGMNDLSMFQPEWLNIAMGNGREVLRRKADYVAPRACDDGIAYAMRHFGWIE